MLRFTHHTILDLINLKRLRWTYRLSSSLLFHFTHTLVGNQDSSVSVVTRLRAGRSGFYFRHGLGFCLFATASRLALGSTEPPIRVPGGPFPGVKRPGRETDHSSPSSTEVWNARSYTSTPPYVFMACYLVKQRDNLSFTILLYTWSFLGSVSTSAFCPHNIVNTFSPQESETTFHTRWQQRVK
jgi:hypothetical protein